MMSPCQTPRPSAAAPPGFQSHPPSVPATLAAAVLRPTFKSVDTASWVMDVPPSWNLNINPGLHWDPWQFD